MRPHIRAFISLTWILSASVFAASPDFYSGFRNLPANVVLYHYKVPDTVLRAQLAAMMGKAKQQQSGKFVATFVLPQFYVYDKSGHEILGHTGDAKDLNKLLDHVFASFGSTLKGQTIAARFDPLVPDGTQRAPRPKLTGKFTVLEYWAPWCVYCFTERDQLLAYFRTHSDVAVNWITVNSDISRVTKVTFSHRPT